MSEQDYETFRGRCKELSEALCAKDPTLRLVRGYYHCWSWGPQQHWWCATPDGSIIDPSVRQFPAPQIGTYEEFAGTVACSNCGTEVAEDEATYDSRYAFCSYTCHGQFVGVF